MVGEVEGMLEVAKCQALMKHARIVCRLSLSLPGHSQSIALLDQLYFVRSKSRKGHAYPILILPHSFDVVGGPVRPRSGVQHVEEPVEADRGAEQGRKIVSPHHHILLEQHGNERRCRAFWPRRWTRYFGLICASRGSGKFFRA